MGDRALKNYRDCYLVPMYIGSGISFCFEVKEPHATKLTKTTSDKSGLCSLTGSSIQSINAVIMIICIFYTITESGDV